MLQVNPLQLIQMIREGQNPEQLMISVLENQIGSTPFGENLLLLAKQNRTQDIEKIARNMCEQRGLDFDQEFAAFKQKIGIQ